MTIEEQRESNRQRQLRYLEKNREKVNALRRERYSSRIDDKACPRCGKKLAKNYDKILCADCLEYSRDNQSKNSGKKQNSTTSKTKKSASKKAAPKTDKKTKPKAKPAAKKSGAKKTAAKKTQAKKVSAKKTKK